MTLQVAPFPTLVEMLESRRLLSAGLSPDDTFGVDGFTTVPSNIAALSGVADISGGPAGKVYVLANGQGQEIIRYNANGTVDSNFGVGGRFLLGFPASALEAAADGSVLVAGVGVMIRLDSNGEFDDDFGVGGIVSLAAPNAIVTAASDIRIENNGDITLLSDATVDGASTNATPAAVINYLNHDGSVDSTIAPNGRRVIALPTTLAGLTGVQATALADDEGVLVGGTSLLQFGHVTVVHVSALGAVLSDVVIDATFNRESTVTGIDTDPFGNIALLTQTALTTRPTVSLYDPEGGALAQTQFATPSLIYNATAIGTQDGGRILLGFDDYAVARLGTGQVAAGVFLSDDGLLQIEGTASGDGILVNRYDSGTLRVTRNGKRTLIERSAVTQIALAGNAGNDVMTVNVDIPVVATGDAGDDVIATAGADDRIAGGDGNDQLSGNGGKDVITGGVGADRLWGGSGKDRLAGEGGKDKLYGGSGDDQLDGGASDDLINGDTGNDKLFGGRGNDTLNGGSGDNQLFPGDGDDVLF